MERKPSKDEAFEALDFIINVLKEHEKDLDRLISQLGIITESLGETGEISGKIEKIEDRLGTLHGEITNLIKYTVNCFQLFLSDLPSFYDISTTRWTNKSPWGNGCLAIRANPFFFLGPNFSLRRFFLLDHLR